MSEEHGRIFFFFKAVCARYSKCSGRERGGGQGGGGGGVLKVMVIQADMPYHFLNEKMDSLFGFCYTYLYTENNKSKINIY